MIPRNRGRESLPSSIFRYPDSSPAPKSFNFLPSISTLRARRHGARPLTPHEAQVSRAQVPSPSSISLLPESSPTFHFPKTPPHSPTLQPIYRRAGSLNPHEARDSRAQGSCLIFLPSSGTLRRVPFCISRPAPHSMQPINRGEAPLNTRDARVLWAQESSLFTLPSSGIRIRALVFSIPRPTAPRCNP